MRVLLVSQYFWPERFRINDLAVELAARGHEVEVLTGMPNYPEGKPYEGYRHWWPQRHESYHDGIKVHRVPLFLRRQGRGWQLALNYLSFVFSASFFAPWYFRKQSFDVVFVFEPSPFTVGIPATLMRKLKRAPMLFWVQDLWPESVAAVGHVRSAWALGVIARMVRWIYRRCDRVLVQSEAFVDLAVRSGADISRIRYFPNWAEDFYRPIETLAGSGSKVPEMADGLRVMFAGNLGEAQSLETILDAADRLRDRPVNWIIVGGGRRRAWMEEEASRMGLEECLTFVGSFPAEEMPDLFAQADVLLVTLKKDETFARTVPSKIQSYMACGKPIAAAIDGEGARILNEAGCGLTTDAEDGAGLAGIVERFLDMDEPQRCEMGKRGRSYYLDHFERGMLVTRLEQWMKEAVEEGLCAS